MRSAVVLPILLAFALPVNASHCTEPSSGTDANDIDTGVVYIVNDGCDPECGFFNVWIYAESNGHPGLQRGDELDDNTCHGMVPPDTVVF